MVEFRKSSIKLNLKRQMSKVMWVPNEIKMNLKKDE